MPAPLQTTGIAGGISETGKVFERLDRRPLP